ncbi:hypothetical protein [Legionella sp. km772]|uniref:hypothetical protein n=1 Tax=Legionella sp. km772 TaxID=2498111 RepID=UPI000F8D8C88|nr:hypothetical protein [Legionella sp. km772]RUR04217.1 hypothetical protein ELY15_15790 [Legionella sp. km772]
MTYAKLTEAFERAAPKKPSPDELVRQVIEQLPSNPDELPRGFVELDPDDVMRLIEEQAVDNGPLQYQVKSGEDVTRKLLADLDRLKNKLGGAPNFAGGIVTLNDADLARSGDLEQNSGKIRAIPGLLVHSPYSQNGLSTSP